MPSTFLLDAAAALLARRTSIIVGTRDAAHQPHLVRAVGCRIEAGSRKLRVLLPADGSASLLADLASNGCIAVVLSEPSTHRTLQVKGIDASVEDATPEDFELAARYLEGFVDEIGTLGFPAAVAQTMLRFDGPLQVVRFTPTEGFEQTPGPAAGHRLSAGIAGPST